MDAQGFDDERLDIDPTATDDGAEGGVDDRMFDLGGDERRMHVRAYNHWVSLLKNRAYPNIEDLDPASIADFGPNSVLLDFSAGLDDPRIAFLGAALKAECELDNSISHISQVPSRSLLSRLTDHYLQIIANRAPIGFEAEFVGTRGRNTLYRGILMPFSSDGAQIDFIYGVINWKELVDAATQARLDGELAAARQVMPAEAPYDVVVWADGPGAARDTAETDGPNQPSPDREPSLDHQLSVARESAAAVRAADTRSRAALYRALGRAHDFSLAAAGAPGAYQGLLDTAGIKAQARAPMTAVAKLVFGADYDKTRLTEFAAVLDHARRHALDPGALPGFLDGQTGGIKAVVAAERLARRPAAPADPFLAAAAALRLRPVLAEFALADSGDDEFVLLLARRSGPTLGVVAQLDALMQQAVRRAAGAVAKG